ncbi:RIP metalloprotease RseP [Verrucomicrobiota bacterium]
MTLLLIVGIFLLFGITVFVHEFGHFIAARKCGLVVETFAIGFGPSIWQKEKDGIVYKIGIIPFGGYVALPQLDPEGMEKMQGETEGSAKTLPHVAAWKKIVVAVSGPLGNIILASLLAWAIYFAPGDSTKHNIAVVGSVDADSAVYAQGLREGDQITAINGKSVKSWYDLTVEALLAADNSKAVITAQADGQTKTISTPFNDPEKEEMVIPGVTPAIPCVLGLVSPGSPAGKAGIEAGDVVIDFDGVAVRDWIHFTDLVQKYPDQSVPVTLERKGELVKLSVIPKYDAEHDRAMIGVQLGSFMPWMHAKNPATQLKNDAASIFRLLKALVNPKESKKAAGGLGGPLAIFIMIFASLKTGLLNTMGLIRFLNVNLAVLNLLPLPVLDGGHIIFASWEGITRRKVHPKVVNTLVNAFAVLLIGAMLLLTFRDADRQWKISRLFNGGQTVEQVEQPAEEAEALPQK